jgi:IclR family transcriptional regulator, acetate operon repressor
MPIEMVMRPMPAVEGAETARRALRLLTALVRAGGPADLESMQRETGLNRSTAYRILRALAEEGFVGRTDDGRFEVGARLTELAAAALPNLDAYAACRPIMSTLAEAAGETVTLHRRVGQQTVVVVSAESDRHALRHHLVIGRAKPLFRGCAGLAIVASLPEVDFARTRDAAVVAGDDGALLDASVQEIKAIGYAVSFGANHPGVNGVAVAVPLLDAAKTTRYSLTVSGPEARWTRSKMTAFANRVRTSADLLAGLLLDGYGDMTGASIG